MLNPQGKVSSLNKKHMDVSNDRKTQTIYPNDDDFLAKQGEQYVMLDELTLILPPSPIKHQGQTFD